MSGWTSCSSQWPGGEFAFSSSQTSSEGKGESSGWDAGLRELELQPHKAVRTGVGGLSPRPLEVSVRPSKPGAPGEVSSLHSSEAQPLGPGAQNGPQGLQDGVLAARTL